MKALIDSLNLGGQRLLDFAGPMLIQSSVLILALLLLDWALRPHVRAIVRYAIWLLVPVKLLLPPSLALPTGPGYWLRTGPPSAAMTEAEEMTVTNVGLGRTTVIAPVAVPGAPRLQPPARLSRAGWFGLIWLGGSAGFLVFLVHRSRLVAAVVRRAEAAPEALQGLLRDCARQLRVGRGVRLRLIPDGARTVCGPAICGLWRPVILLPRRLADSLSPSQLRVVLLHELGHLRRGDLWVNHAQAFLQIAYWWHPLLWQANALLRRVREQAVDETVMFVLGHESELYPATLVEVAKLAWLRPALALGLVGILESKSALKERVMLMLNRPAPRTATLGLAGLVATLVLGAVLLPMAQGGPAADPDRVHPTKGASALSPPAAREGRVTGLPAGVGMVPLLSNHCDIEIKVFVVVSNVFPAALLGQPATNHHGWRAWILSDARALDLALYTVTKKGLKLLSAPRVQTGSGEQAQIFIGASIPAAGDRFLEEGLRLELVPEIRGSAIEVAFQGQLTERRQTQPLSLKTNFSVAMRLLVPAGHSAVLSNPDQPDDQGRVDLLILKPAFGQVSSTENAKKIVSIKVTADGKYRWNGVVKTIEEVAAELASQAREEPDFVVQIRCHSATPMAAIAALIDRCTQLKLASISLHQDNTSKEQ